MSLARGTRHGASLTPSSAAGAATVPAWPATCLLAACLLSAACMNHFVAYPRTAPPSVVTWSQDVDRGPLRIHLEWASPAGEGLLPVVLVHPEAGGTARDMRGVVWDLATRGYLAVSADYRRRIGRDYRRTLFPFRSEEDVTAALAVVRANPRAAPGQLALVGFSQGGVFSLLMAARDPGVKAVVAYYPVTDFVHWLNDPSYSRMRRLVFRLVRRHFRRQAGARTEAEFAAMAERASPLRHVEGITAPVLLVHGVNDRTASIGESRRMAAALKALGREVHVLEIPGAGHVFNFYDKQAPRARAAWGAALDFLHDRMPPAPPATPGR